MLRAGRMLAAAGLCLVLLSAPARGQDPVSARTAMPAPPQAAPAGSGEAAAETRESPAARARARAHDDMDGLRREIRVLGELHEAQKALLEWNRLRVETGEPAAVLDAEICARMKDWCAALPATFGGARERSP